MPFENVLEIDLSETSGLPEGATPLGAVGKAEGRGIGVGTRSSFL